MIDRLASFYYRGLFGEEMIKSLFKNALCKSNDLPAFIQGAEGPEKIKDTIEIQPPGDLRM
ncbi:MAG: hypothetical protein ACOYXT_25370 [Bacteroidota bacterium]